MERERERERDSVVSSHVFIFKVITSSAVGVQTLTERGELLQYYIGSPLAAAGFCGCSTVE
jgi:hypothetical protein